jgi:hypothetical protein
VSAIRYGAGGCQFAYNWDGLWIGTRANTFERIVAWQQRAGHWSAYRRIIVNPMQFNEKEHRGPVTTFTSFDAVLEHWDICSPVEVTND